MVPLATDTLIQLESLTDAVQDPPLHPLGLALTVKVVEPPLEGTRGTVVGVTENVQVIGVAPAWGTVMPCPAIVTVPERALVPAFER